MTFFFLKVQEPAMSAANSRCRETFSRILREHLVTEKILERCVVKDKNMLPVKNNKFLYKMTKCSKIVRTSEKKVYHII